MSIDINLKRAKELVQEAIDSVPDGPNFRYVSVANSGCAYVPITDQNYTTYVGSYGELPPEDNRRKTGCIVGTALSKAGIDWSKVSSWHLSSRFRYIYKEGAFKDQDEEVNISEGALAYFVAAQNAQDLAETWDEAQARADGATTDFIK